MCDLLGRFEREPEFVRCQRFPILDCLRRRDPVESVIDLGGRKPLGVKRQHLRRWQIFRIEISFPFRVLKTGGANPSVHKVIRNSGYINFDRRFCFFIPIPGFLLSLFSFPNQSTPTAREMSRITMLSEIKTWIMASTLAQRASNGASVGPKVELWVNATNR